MSGNHTSSNSPDSAAGTRTWAVQARCRPVPAVAALTARSASEYSGSSTRSCSSAAPANHTTTSGHRATPSSRRPA
ncbi:hypothetical protein B1H19_31555 [Streptomyces gilvosporeus]|uniref:Uncharacterized protein n=1 Tax=Streptomyces gilvosporeus TaxID=553510 RepID=A0A1V0TYQ9_9ACTN|nr:hypothetical protein B1H19_31555 [Streptomyces gilvosporeus]